MGEPEAHADAGTRRAAVYTHLPAGHYRFRVVACNNDGVWSQAGASLPFSVLPPFWKTWWFISLCSLAALGTAGGAARYISLRNLRAELKRLEQQYALEKERSRIARDIHDDLGAGLTQITLLSELGQKNGAAPKELESHFRQISDRAREIIQSMDAIVWAVNPKNDTLDHLADYLPRFAEDFLRSTAIRCRIDVPPVLPEVPLTAEIRHHLFLTVKEALHNVVKHSSASEVWIRLSVDGNTFSIIIEDNGPGFLPPHHSPAPRGNGLSNMKKRLDEIGGRVEFHSRPGQGTKMILTVPVQPILNLFQ